MDSSGGRRCFQYFLQRRGNRGLVVEARKCQRTILVAWDRALPRQRMEPQAPVSTGRGSTVIGLRSVAPTHLEWQRGERPVRAQRMQSGPKVGMTMAGPGVPDVRVAIRREGHPERRPSPCSTQQETLQGVATSSGQSVVPRGREERIQELSLR